mmetsp:Transcript_28450/g.88485  ORF Transcript_28450/g.88485 Transcript_28450/m.88485 type:complete len:423 (-) Transcript_28450:360-1628(-)
MPHVRPDLRQHPRLLLVRRHGGLPDAEHGADSEAPEIAALPSREQGRPGHVAPGPGASGGAAEDPGEAEGGRRVGPHDPLQRFAHRAAVRHREAAGEHPPALRLVGAAGLRPLPGDLHAGSGLRLPPPAGRPLCGGHADGQGLPPHPRQHGLRAGPSGVPRCRGGLRDTCGAGHVVGRGFAVDLLDARGHVQGEGLLSGAHRGCRGACPHLPAAARGPGSLCGVLPQLPPAGHRGTAPRQALVQRPPGARHGLGGFGRRHGTGGALVGERLRRGAAGGQLRVARPGRQLGSPPEGRDGRRRLHYHGRPRPAGALGVSRIASPHGQRRQHLRQDWQDRRRAAQSLLQASVYQAARGRELGVGRHALDGLFGTVGGGRVAVPPGGGEGRHQAVGQVWLAVQVHHDRRPHGGEGRHPLAPAVGCS